MDSGKPIPFRFVNNFQYFENVVHLGLKVLLVQHHLLILLGRKGIFCIQKAIPPPFSMRVGKEAQKCVQVFVVCRRCLVEIPVRQALRL